MSVISSDRRLRELDAIAARGAEQVGSRVWLDHEGWHLKNKVPD